MKKFIIIGNPIKQSLSPKLHNYWFEKYKLSSIYERRLTYKEDLEKLCIDVKEGKLNGFNVTVPFKRDLEKFLEKLSPEAKQIRSVNTVSLENGVLTGHNTDYFGFEKSIEKINYDINKKKVLIIGAGGVVPSLIYALNKMHVSNIIVINRTKEKAEELKKNFKNITIMNWGEDIDFDMVINATSLGLNDNDKFNLKLLQNKKNKFFYDVIYSPKKTEFFEEGNSSNNLYENGLNMFLFQAQKAFSIWNKIEPKVDEDLVKFILN